MKRLVLVASVLVLSLAMVTNVFAAGGPRIRVVHASPDAPAVDIWADDAPAFQNAPFKGITSYATLSPGMHNFKVVPAGATSPVVIEADLDLQDGVDYTVVAVNTLDAIEPLVLVDNNAAPAAGKAHVRFVHASPDAPAVDIRVANGGPTLFGGISFKGAGDYLPVDAGTYDLEVVVSGTDTVALNVPGVALGKGNVYTIFAMGLAGGEPALMAVPSLDASAAPIMLPATGGANINLILGIFVAGAGLLMMGVGLLRRKAQEI